MRIIDQMFSLRQMAGYSIDDWRLILLLGVFSIFLPS